MTEQLPARFRDNPLAQRGLGDLIRDDNSGFWTYSGLCVKDEEGAFVNPSFGTYDRRVDWRKWRRRTAGRTQG